jgi:hypothetical protein
MTNYVELKKKRERFFAEEGAKLMGKTWNLGPDREHPDFLMTEGAQQFGLEVSEIFTGWQDRAGSAMKEKESKAQRAVDALRREYEAITNIPLIVKLVGDVCAENLALVVPALVAEDLASKPVGHRVVIAPDTGLRAGLRVHVTKARRPNWFSVKDRVGWVDHNAMPRIAVAVKNKSKDLPRYRRAVGSDDIHLLLVANHINNSGKLVVEEQVQLPLQGFKVVYFFPYPDPIVTIFDSGPDALGSASTIYVEASGTRSGMKLRRFREGDLVRFRAETRMRFDDGIAADEVGTVVEVEPHPPQTGPNYKIAVQFPARRVLPFIFEFEYELVKAAPSTD